MPGVFRDPTDDYRYFSVNEYEERRRRDLDDRYMGRYPGGPFDPFGPRRPAWSPGAPLSMRFAGVPTPAAKPSPEAFDFEAFRTRVNEWQDVPNEAGILAVINGDQVPLTDNTWFDKLVASLPNRVGEKPAFDALVANPQVTTVDYKHAVDMLMAAAG